MSEYKPMLIIINHSQKAADKIKPYICSSAWEFFNSYMRHIVDRDEGYAINVPSTGDFSFLNLEDFKKLKKLTNKEVLNLSYHKRRKLSSNRLPK